MAQSALAQIRQFRIDKANKLREMGINPYPSQAKRDCTILEITNNYEKYENKEVTLAGRLVSWREHGHLIFGHIQDQDGKIQLYIKDDIIEKTDFKNGTLGFEELTLLDMGDIVQASGIITKTQRGEVSLMPKKIKLLTKAIRPLPEKWSGIKDKETLFRQRYLDMIMNPEKKLRFKQFSQITFAIRQFMFDRGFEEIKTPLIQPIYGGTNAKPFKTQVHALGNETYYLAVAHELYLKKLITAGFEKVFNLVGYFRNEGIDRTHNPEFTMLETMSAYENYEYNMNLIEEMYKFITSKVFNKSVFKVGGQDVDFSKEWAKMSMVDAVKQYTKFDFSTMKTLEDAYKALDLIGFKEAKPKSIGECMVKAFEEKVEHQLIQPTFITGHPVEISPLAKQMDNDPRYVERFEIYLGGFEGGDNWTELNDPVELYKRLANQVEKGRGGDDEFHPMDIDFIECMEYGMPPTTGLGPGIERLTMMLTETEYIDDVLFFPMQKPSPISDLQKELYDEKYLAKLDGVVDASKNDNPTTTIKPVNTSQDFSKKMVIILQRDLASWQLTNTVGHIGAFLGAEIGKQNLQSQKQFLLAQDESIPGNSQYPVVTVSAKAGQMFGLLQKIEELGLPHIAYTQEMIDFNKDEELANDLKTKEKSSLNYLGIGVFAENEVIDQLTKKFSLWK